MIIISSPSGAGKTTLVKLLSERLNFYISTSHTTRKPRKNEINSKDYFFVQKIEFEKLIKENYFLEYANVFENLYGTSKSNNNNVGSLMDVGIHLFYLTDFLIGKFRPLQMYLENNEIDYTEDNKAVKLKNTYVQTIYHLQKSNP